MQEKLYLFYILSVSVLVSLPFEEWYHQVSQEVCLRSQTGNGINYISIRERTLLRRIYDGMFSTSCELDCHYSYCVSDHKQAKISNSFKLTDFYVFPAFVQYFHTQA